MYIVCSSNPLTGVSYFYFIIIIIFLYIYDDRFNAVCKSLRESNEGAVARMTAAACTRILHYIPIAPRGGAVTADIIYIIILYTIAT